MIQEDRRMVRFRNYYAAYRRLGFSRFDALRFAWIVTSAGARPIPVRATTNRWRNERF
jgi:hypothetical protein